MIGMLIGTVVTGLIGILLIVAGVLIWKKERIDLFQQYHAEGIVPEDRKAFCTLSGIGILVMGSGLAATAVIFGMTGSTLSFLLFAAGTAAGLVMLVLAGIRYHRQ